MSSFSTQNRNAQSAIDAESFEFTKLEISSYLFNSETKEQTDEDSKQVSINPTGYSRTFKASGKSGNCSKKLKAAGDIYTPKTVQFLETVDFELLLDNTGVIPNSEDVPKTIDWLVSKMAKYDGEAHTTRYVKLSWGYLKLNSGQLKTMTVEFLMFNQDGTPLRAKAKISVEGIFEPGVKDAEDRKSSPDLTHVRVVKDGDNLPAMCNTIYKDASLYLKVAEANGLANFMQLPVGQKIYFPPLRQMQL